MKKVLTIAGSDCSGGAGIQADIKTITAHKMYAMSAVTALTAQNTTGVFGILEADADFVAKQIDCIFADIAPDAVKIGMVSSVEIIEVIAQKLRRYEVRNVVVDPVMVSTSGGRLLSDAALGALMERLLPLGRVITPNIVEASVLCGIDIVTEEDMKRAGALISAKTGTAVLVKGGHRGHDAVDFLCAGAAAVRYASERVDNPNTHGTGCTLSSAIACGLAEGRPLEESVERAKAYLTGALRDGLDLGRGAGPLNHVYAL